MSDYWFKRRRYGYGWTPTSPQGWVVLTSYTTIVIAVAIILGISEKQPDSRMVGGYIVGFVILTVAMIVITARTGPKPKWRWGTSPEDDPSEDF